MKKIFLSVSFLITLFVLFNSCSDSTSPKDDVEQIDSKILINLREELSPQGRNLMLDCQTEKIYPCFNFGIMNNVVQKSNLFKIKFLGIFVPEICLTALGPARCYINLGQLNDGNYSLSLEVNGQVISAQLTVSKNVYKINYQQNPHFAFKNPELYRVPDNLIWGWIDYYDDSLSVVADSFLDSLQILGAQTVQLEKGDYGFFKVDSLNNLIFSGFPKRTFAYKYEDTLEEIQELIFRYYFPSIQISLSDWRGAVIYNWVIVVEDHKR